MRKSLYSAGALLSVGAIALTGCTPNSANNASGNSGGTADGSISVTSTDTACKLSATEVKAGKATFNVKNEGSKVTEFYVLGSDGLRIISEVENIGPNLSRDLTVELPEGSYKTACKPGMVGDGIKGDLKVVKNESAKPISADEQAMRDTAVTQYSAYVKDQVEALKTDTDEFAKLYQEGKNDEAKAKYAAARIHYERIEPIAEKSYGKTLDLKLDARETDLEEGNVQEWTGWHKIEKDLWQPKADANDGKEYKPLTTEERKQISEKLVKDTQELYDYVHSDEFKLDAFQISNGAKELLDEVVNTKLTGEEENWSHTDLSDFQGNVDGAKVDYENLLPILQKKNPELAKTLQEKFDAVQKILDKYKQGDGFKPYDELSKEEVRELSDAVTALAEPVSQMTETVAGGESAEGKSGDTSSSKPAASSESSAGASQDASEPAAGTSSATAK